MNRLTVLMILALVLVGCGSSGLDRPVVTAEPTVEADGVQRVEVDMHSYYFEPNRIVVHKGKPVELKLKNCSHIVPHNFTLNGGGMNVNESKWGWGSDTVRFTPETEGEFKFFCHKGSHAEKGMTGTLVVIE